MATFPELRPENALGEAQGVAVVRRALTGRVFYVALTSAFAAVSLVALLAISSSPAPQEIAVVPSFIEQSLGKPTRVHSLVRQTPAVRTAIHRRGFTVSDVDGPIALVQSGTSNRFSTYSH